MAGPRRLVSPTLQTFTAALGLDDVAVTDVSRFAEERRAAALVSLAIRIAVRGADARGCDVLAARLRRLSPVVERAEMADRISRLDALYSDSSQIAPAEMIAAARNVANEAAYGNGVSVARAALFAVEKGKASTVYPIDVDAMVKVMLEEDLRDVR